MRKTCAQPAGNLRTTNRPKSPASLLCGKLADLYKNFTQTVRLFFHTPKLLTTAVNNVVVHTFHTPYIRRQKETLILNTRYVSGELL
jgi:hypothetical protein